MPLLWKKAAAFPFAFNTEHTINIYAGISVQIFKFIIDNTGGQTDE